MTDAEIIDGVMAREGDTFTEHPRDRGGATKFGITAATLGGWRALGRQATRDEVKALTRAEAAQIYRHLYVVSPGLTQERFLYEPLRVQVIDDGVLSGPRAAIQTLQLLLGVEADGIFGPLTRAALAQADQEALHVAYLKARALRLGLLVQRDPSQAVFLVGWLARVLSFLEGGGRV